MNNLTQAEIDILLIWESIKLPANLREVVAPTIDAIRIKIRNYENVDD